MSATPLYCCALRTQSGRCPVGSVFANTRRARQRRNDWGADIRGDVCATPQVNYRHVTPPPAISLRPLHLHRREVAAVESGPGNLGLGAPGQLARLRRRHRFAVTAWVFLPGGAADPGKLVCAARSETLRKQRSENILTGISSSATLYARVAGSRTQVLPGEPPYGR